MSFLNSVSYLKDREELNKTGLLEDTSGAQSTGLRIPQRPTLSLSDLDKLCKSPCPVATSPRQREGTAFGPGGREMSLPRPKGKTHS